jgi:hypothetical protein
VVFVLLEEDQVTDAGARAGYAALVDYLRKQINGYIPGADRQQVTYRIGGGHLYEMYWRGGDPPTRWDLMERSGAPEAVSDPAVFYSAATNTTHVIYRGPFGHLFELWFVPGGQPTVVDLTLAALAPRAVDHPSAFTVDAANLRYVV